MNTSVGKLIDSRKATFYAVTCALVVLIVSAGFGPAYIGAMLNGAVTPIILHFHAIIKIVFKKVKTEIYLNYMRFRLKGTNLI